MDLSFEDAIARHAPPIGPAPEGEPEHRVLLGPVPCRGCGAWVEWAGVDWLAIGSTERHECAPYLRGGERVLRPDPEQYLRIRARSGDGQMRRLERVEPEGPELPAIPWQLIAGLLIVAALVILAAGWRPA